jgi:hypothetical protein
MDLVRLYVTTRNALRELCRRRDGFDFDYLMDEDDLKHFLKMENLMDLSFFFYQFYSTNDHSILQQMEDIFERKMVCDDSDLSDVMIYHHSYFFLHLNGMPEYYSDLIEKLCQMGSGYQDYIHSKDEFDTLLILQGDFDISI